MYTPNNSPQHMPHMRSIRQGATNVYSRSNSQQSVCLERLQADACNAAVVVVLVTVVWVWPITVLIVAALAAVRVLRELLCCVCVCSDCCAGNQQSGQEHTALEARNRHAAAAAQPSYNTRKICFYN